MLEMLGQFKYPKEIAKEIAEREKKKRKRRNITQEEMSRKTGVSLGTIKRFEQTGEISFVTLLKIADVLGEMNDFQALFASKEYQSIQEVIDEKR